MSDERPPLSNEETHRIFREVIGRNIQTWNNAGEHAGNGIVTAWIVIAEVADANGRKWITALSGSGIEGDDETTWWQRLGMAEYVVEESRRFVHHPPEVER